MPFVSRKEAAQELGFSRQRLEKLIKQGRIEETDRGVDIEQARRVRSAMLDLRQALHASDGPSSVEAPLEVASTSETVGGESGSDAAKRARKAYDVKRGSEKIADPETGKPIDYASERTKRERANRLRAEVAYRREVGELIAIDEVKAKEFAVARKLRDRILGFPARIQNFLPPDAMKIIVDECDQLIRELQEDAARIAERSETD